jgi:hypothetical protein
MREATVVEIGEESMIVGIVGIVGKLEEIGKDIQSNYILGIESNFKINFVRFYATLHFIILHYTLETKLISAYNY